MKAYICQKDGDMRIWGVRKIPSIAARGRVKADKRPRQKRHTVKKVCEHALLEHQRIWHSALRQSAYSCSLAHNSSPASLLGQA